MTEQDLVQVPNPLLARVAAPCGEADPDLAADLADTLQVLPGAVGVAAPQLGVSVRAVCVDVSHHPLVQRHDLAHHGHLVLFDPVLHHAEGTAAHRESCSSVPDFATDVRRAARIVISGLDPEGQTQVVRAESLEARALQHQLDHLDGRLILNRAAGVRPKVFRPHEPAAWVRRDAVPPPPT